MASWVKISPLTLPAKPFVWKSSFTLPCTTGLASRPNQAALERMPGSAATCLSSASDGEGTLTCTSLAFVAVRYRS